MNWFRADREQAVFSVTSHLCSMCHFSIQRWSQPASSASSQAFINAITAFSDRLLFKTCQKSLSSGATMQARLCVQFAQIKMIFHRATAFSLITAGCCLQLGLFPVIPMPAKR